MNREKAEYFSLMQSIEFKPIVRQMHRYRCTYLSFRYRLWVLSLMAAQFFDVNVTECNNMIVPCLTDIFGVNIESIFCLSILGFLGYHTSNFGTFIGSNYAKERRHTR